MTQSVEAGSLVARVRIGGSLGNRLGTVLLVTLNISAFSLIGALALSGTWLPFGLSLLTASVLRL